MILRRLKDLEEFNVFLPFFFIFNVEKNEKVRQNECLIYNWKYNNLSSSLNFFYLNCIGSPYKGVSYGQGFFASCMHIIFF